jgi:hypothetical protein
MQKAVAIFAVLVSGMAYGQIPATTASRHITFNGRALTVDQEKRLAAVERKNGIRLPDRDYWYDNRSGAAGLWQGPTLGVLPAGLELGGPMPSHCSGQGTGVYVNGRELPPADVLLLTQLTLVAPGRYWLDGDGNFGFEHSPALSNLVLLARQASGTGSHGVYAASELSALARIPAR